ncbi:phosphotransferase [Streptomyces sp. NPDC001617]
MTDTPLLSALTTRAEAKAHSRTPSCPCGTPETLADRPDATVVRHADIVAKAHAPDTPLADLAPRLAAAAHLPGLFLPPLSPAPIDLRGRLVTFWPYGTPVAPDDPDAAPWEAAATLLARLHRTPAPTRLPPMRGPAKAARAVARLTATAAPTTTPTACASPAVTASPSATSASDSECPATIASPVPTTEEPALAASTPTGPSVRTAETALTPHPAIPSILRAWSTLPAWARAEAPMPDAATLCHGDLHLGQLVRHPVPDGRWLLIDVDDLGTGVPAWDLARPAAWYACGLLPPDEWARFLAAYRAAGGPAVPADGDPWPALDVPARALTVQTAARAVTKAVTENRPLDEIEMSVIDACARMGSLPPELTPTSSK